MPGFVTRSEVKPAGPADDLLWVRGRTAKGLPQLRPGFWVALVGRLQVLS